MPWNGSGTAAPPGADYPVIAGTTILAAVRNAMDSDIYTCLTNCITKDGQSTLLANIPMGGFKLTGLAAGSSNGDSLRYEQIQFTQLGVGAVPQPFSTLFETQLVNIYSFLSGAQIADAKAGTLLVDCGAAIQAAFDSVKVATAGRNAISIWFPPGNYLSQQELIANHGLTLIGGGPWSSGTNAQGSQIVGKHTGNSVLNCKGMNYVNLLNLQLYGSATITPKTVLLRGRSSAASAGFHRMRNCRVGGYSTICTFYSIASEENDDQDNFISNDGGGALYTQFFSQGDGLSVDATLFASSCLGYTSINDHVENYSANAGAATIYIQGGAATGFLGKKLGIIHATAGSYVRIDAGTTDSADAVGPFNFESIEGEGTGAYSYLLTSGPSLGVRNLRVTDTHFPCTTNEFFTTNTQMNVQDSDIHITDPLKPSIFPTVYRSKIHLKAQDITANSCYHSEVRYSSVYNLSLGFQNAERGTNTLIDLADAGSDYAPVFPTQQYGGVETSPTIFRMGLQKIAWHTAIPTLVASSKENSWRYGDRIFKRTVVSGAVSEWACVTSGTFSAYATTGGITIATNALTVLSVTGLAVGDFITIAGVTAPAGGAFRVVGIAGLVVSVDALADATVAGAAVATPDPTFIIAVNAP